MKIIDEFDYANFRCRNERHVNSYQRRIDKSEQKCRYQKAKEEEDLTRIINLTKVYIDFLQEKQKVETKLSESDLT